MPKVALSAFKACVALTSTFFVGLSTSDEFTDGIKLLYLLPAMVLGPVPEGSPFGQTVKHRCMLFLDGEWEELYAKVQRRVVKPPRAPSAGDAEQQMRSQVQRCHAMGDISGMVQAVAREHDPPPSSHGPAFNHVAKYMSLLPQ